MIFNLYYLHNYQFKVKLSVQIKANFDDSFIRCSQVEPTYCFIATAES